MLTPPLPVEVDFRVLPVSEQLTLIYAAQRKILDIIERTSVSDNFMLEMSTIVADSKSKSDKAQALFDQVGRT